MNTNAKINPSLMINASSGSRVQVKAVIGMTEEILELTNDLVNDIIDAADTVLLYTPRENGMSAFMRRLTIMKRFGKDRQLAVSTLSFFVSVHMTKGTNWHLYCNTDKKKKISYTFASNANFLGISTGKNDKVGVSSQVVANAFPEIMVKYRLKNKMVINKIEYTGICPQPYCYAGSLGAMFLQGEEAAPIPFWIIKTVLYLDYINWYISVTSQITKKERKKGTSGTEWIEGILNGMHFAWGSWTMKSRVSFLSSDPVFEAESKNMYSSDEAMKESVLALYKLRMSDDLDVEGLIKAMTSP